MNTLAGFLISITGTLAARVLTSLGIGIFSYAGISVLVNTVVSSVFSNYGQMNNLVLALLNMAGAGNAFSIITAAMVTRASVSAIKRMRPI